MWLNGDVFRTVVASTPLVSIDLVVRNSSGDILLGHRMNRPAKGYWFVPGGRILKNEALDDAFLRLTQTELGHCFKREEARLLGVYEHFYEDSVFGGKETDPDTHYVVLGYQLNLPANFQLEPPVEQHASYRWWSVEEMQQSVDVHENTRAYLRALK